MFAGGIGRRADGQQKYSGKNCGSGLASAEKAVETAVAARVPGSFGGCQHAVAQGLGASDRAAGRNGVEGFGRGAEFGVAFFGGFVGWGRQSVERQQGCASPEPVAACVGHDPE